MVALRRNPKDIVHKDACVCSDHFSPGDIIKVNNTWTLRIGAIPRLNLRPSAKKNLFLYSAQTAVKLAIIPDGTSLPCSSTTEVSIDDNQARSSEKHRQISVLSESESGSQLADSESDINLFGVKRLASTTDSEGLNGSPKKRRKFMRMDHCYNKSPRKLTRSLEESKKVISKTRSELKIEKARVNRLKRKVTNLGDVVKELKRQRLISGNAREVLEKTYTGVPLEIMKRILTNHKKGCTTTQTYPEEIKRFAITLQFFSSKAYNYVRNIFNLALPSASTIRNWITNIECMPGFTQQAFEALGIQVNENIKKGLPTICALMLDEMAIKEQIELKGSKVWGYVECGSEINDDELLTVKDALVLMVVAVNGHYKIPIVYFLTKSLTAQEKVNIMLQALIKLKEINVIVTSITCDGPSAHFAMARKLGAKIDDFNNLEPSFPHPVDGSPVFIIFDVCHMLKLLRNAWAVIKVFYDSEGMEINYKYIEKLVELQNEEGIRFANKLRNVHLQWMKQKMKVSIAAQVLSNSVADAIEFLMTDVKHPFFLNAGPTIKFLRLIDRTFDLLNSKNPFGKGCKGPIRENNKNYWLPIFQQACIFFKTCKNEKQVELIKSQKKTPFLGFTIAIHSVIGIYKQFIEKDNGPLKYLLTYKLSQDHLELFFCSVRSKNGWNNNPTAFQFFHTYRRLLAYHEVRNNNGNCINQDSTTFLSVHVKRTRKADIGYTVTNEDVTALKKFGITIEEHLQDHDYTIPEIPALSLLSSNVVTYISGFVIKMIKRRIKCEACLSTLEQLSFTMDDSFLLIHHKDRGGLVKPSQDVVAVCQYTERKIRQVLIVNDDKMPKEDGFFDSFVNVLTHDILSEGRVFKALADHMYELSFFAESHSLILIKSIVSSYCLIRFHSIIKTQTDKLRGELIRKTLSKVILFRHQ